MSIKNQFLIAGAAIIALGGLVLSLASHNEKTAVSQLSSSPVTTGNDIENGQSGKQEDQIIGGNRIILPACAPECPGPWKNPQWRKHFMQDTP